MFKLNKNITKQSITKFENAIRSRFVETSAQFLAKDLERYEDIKVIVQKKAV